MSLDSKETKLESSEQDAFPSADKNTSNFRTILRMEVWPFSGGVNICYDKRLLDESHKNYSKINASFTYNVLFLCYHMFYYNTMYRICVIEST